MKFVTIAILAATSAATVLGLGCGAKSGLLTPDVDGPAGAPSSSPTSPTTPAGTDPTAPPTPPTPPATPDFTFVVPYLAPPTPSRKVVELASTTIKEVDVAFSVDTTGSMGSSIKGLTETLSTKVMPDLQKSIPNIGFAVVDHKDSEAMDPWTVMVRQAMTADIGSAQAAVAAMTATGGSDEPEAQEESMLYILTGGAIDSKPPIAAHVSPAGTFGAVDFHPGAVPIVVELTDAHWHDARTMPWTGGPGDTVTLDALSQAFVRTHARFVAVTDMHEVGSSGPAMSELLTQPNRLSDATASNVPVEAFRGECGVGKCCTGISGAPMLPDGPGGTCRLNFQVQNGVGMTDSLVSAIAAIALGSEFDVAAAPVNDPTNPLGDDGRVVDATHFIAALRAMDEGDPASGCVAHPATDTDGDGIKDQFLGVRVGTHVCFEVVPKTNDEVKPKAFPQRFYAYVDVFGLPGRVLLDARRIGFVVPAIDGSI